MRAILHHTSTLAVHLGAVLGYAGLARWWAADAPMGLGGALFLGACVWGAVLAVNALSWTADL